MCLILDKYSSKNILVTPITFKIYCERYKHGIWPMKTYIWRISETFTIYNIRDAHNLKYVKFAKTIFRNFCITYSSINFLKLSFMTRILELPVSSPCLDAYYPHWGFCNLPESSPSRGISRWYLRVGRDRFLILSFFQIFDAV